MSSTPDEKRRQNLEPTSRGLTGNNAGSYRRVNASNFDLVSPTEEIDQSQGQNGSDVSSIFSGNDGEMQPPTPRTLHKRSNTLSKEYTEQEENTVVKKLDRKLVLFLAFLYLLSFLDRSSMHVSRFCRNSQN